MKRLFWWIGWLLLAGCAPTPAVIALPTRMPLADMPVLPAPAALPPTHTPAAEMVPTASVPAPAPTAVPPTPLPPTPLPTQLAAPAACRPAAALADVRPAWLVRPGPWPRPAAAPGLLGRAAPTDPPLLHLGFDVEGDPAFVPDLLAVLERRQVLTTFFVLGSWADTYPDLVQAIVRGGHELASHGYSHADMAGLTAEQVRYELRSAELAVGGQPLRPWLRPPFGSHAEASVQAAYAAGYTTVIWSGSANDWRRGMDADRMCETLRAYAVPGAILYAHTNRAEIVTAVDRFVAEMQAAGYTFVPLSVLMADDPGVWLGPAAP